MKPALLPTVALCAAMSTFLLPPVLALTGAAPNPSKPVPMLVVQADDGPTIATRKPSVSPVSSPEKAVPAAATAQHLTRVASR
jgi:hypothetical protein